MFVILKLPILIIHRTPDVIVIIISCLPVWQVFATMNQIYYDVIALIVTGLVCVRSFPGFVFMAMFCSQYYGNIFN